MMEIAEDRFDSPIAWRTRSVRAYELFLPRRYDGAGRREVANFQGEVKKA